MRFFLFLILIVCVIITGCNSGSNTTSKSSGDWNTLLVTWKENLYTYHGEEVSSDKIGKEIGEVTVYSDEETRDFTRKDVFSNFLQAGTKLYTITDTAEEKAIAAKDIKNQKYIKLIYESPYSFQ
ncbi:hypothetical protein [Paenibacillus sp. OV219]|uniref:hypothetical protein n=1 Tax=Paenibacillus sp. OV219 TaxID=1884377 RepID=UPI0008C75EFF|nr:hypothetical protein [Paenibacillus sp. OV219]SEP17887.1 hypothetical protein SAMN05518847_1267 [Paenibacillus sp. OV219]